MAAIYTPNCVQVVQRFTDDTNIWENVYHVDNGTPAGIGDLDNIFDAFHDWESASGASVRSMGVKTYEFELTALDTVDSPRKTYTLGTLIVGTVAQALLPANVTLAVRLEGMAHRRADTGRTYWVGLFETSTAGSNILVGIRDDILAAMEALGAALVAIGRFLVILSKVLRKLPREQGVMSPVQAYSADLNLDSQRRRLNTRGS